MNKQGPLPLSFNFCCAITIAAAENAPAEPYFRPICLYSSSLSFFDMSL